MGRDRDQEQEQDDQERKGEKDELVEEEKDSVHRENGENREDKKPKRKTLEHSSDSYSESDSGGSESSESEEEDMRMHKRTSEKRRSSSKRRHEHSDSGSSSYESESECSDSEEERSKRDEEDEKRGKKRKDNEKKEKGKKAAVTDSWGKHGILKEVDMWNKMPEFKAWLMEVKEVNLESLPISEQKKMVIEYMADYNTATFPSKKYYNLDAYHNEKMEKEMRKGGEESVVSTEKTVLFSSQLPGAHEPMLLHVRMIRGRLGSLSVIASDTVEMVKTTIESFGANEVLHIIYKGRILKHETTLEDNKIPDYGVVLVVLKEVSNVLSLDSTMPSYIMSLIKKSSSQLIDKEVWYKTGMTLLELARHLGYARVMVDYHMVDVLVMHLSLTHSKHLFRKEFCLRIIANMTTHECLVEKITSTVSLRENIILQAYLLHSPSCLLQVFRLINLCLNSRESITWVKEVLNKNILNRTAEIVQLNTDPTLLFEILKVIAYLLGNHNEASYDFLMEFLMILNAVLDRQATTECAKVFTLGAGLIELVLDQRADVVSVLAKDLSFFQCILDSFLVAMHDDTGAWKMSSFFNILFQLLGHVRETDMTVGDLYPYIKLILKNRGTIGTMVQWYRSSKIDGPTVAHKLQRKVICILKRWIALRSLENYEINKNVESLLDTL